LILSDREIEAALAAGDIEVQPPPESLQYATSALDLFLDGDMYEHKTPEDLRAGEPCGVEREAIVAVDEITWKEFSARYTKPVPPQDDGSFVVRPGEFVLGRTREWVGLKPTAKIAARVEGRSTLARLGLAVHITAPTIHAGFAGRIVLEMFNFGQFRLRLRPGRLHVCQLIFERLGQEPKGEIRTGFHGQEGVR